MIPGNGKQYTNDDIDSFSEPLLEAECIDCFRIIETKRLLYYFNQNHDNTSATGPRYLVSLLTTLRTSLRY